MDAPLRVLLAAPDAASAGWAAAPQLAQALGRADALPAAEPGRSAQCLRCFDVLPRALPIAPLSRLLDAEDADEGRWMRCDPAHVRADLGAVRMLAHGTMLGLDAAESTALAASLLSLFGDFGYRLSTPHPARWYLQLPRDSRPPDFQPPHAVLGDDLFTHLPEGAEGKRWRALLNEAQIILHQHDTNQKRSAAGKPAVNSLWFWGAGVLPDSVRTGLRGVLSEDPILHALARLAGLSPIAADALWHHGPALLDLQHVRDLAELERSVWPELQTRLRQGDVARLLIDFDDGRRFLLAPKQHWRIWRRSLAA
jgi:hypothetical protein